MLPVVLAYAAGCRPATETREGDVRPALPMQGQQNAATAESSEPQPPAVDDPAPPEVELGVSDIGVFSDLDPQVQVELPAGLTAAQTLGVIDVEHDLLVLYLVEPDGEPWPIKVYPLLAREGRELALGEQRLRLRPGDH